MKNLFTKLLLFALLFIPMGIEAQIQGQDLSVLNIWIDAPSLSVMNNNDGSVSLVITESGNMNPANMETYYSIDYADESLTDVVEALYSSNMPPTLSGGCMVSAYTRSETYTSNTTEAVYYAISLPSNNLIYDGHRTKITPTLVPALKTDAGHNLHFELYADSGNNSREYDEETGEEYLYLNAPGHHTFGVEIYGGESLKILNSLKDFTVKMRPAAPVISPDGGIYQYGTSFHIESSGMAKNTVLMYQVGNGNPDVFTNDVWLWESATVKAWVEIDNGNGKPQPELTSDTTAVHFGVTPSVPSMFIDSSDELCFEYSSGSNSVWYSIDGAPFTLFEDNNPPTVSPGSVTKAFQMSADGLCSDTITGKYFALEWTYKETVYGEAATIALPHVIPSIEPEDSVKVVYENAGGNYVASIDEEAGELVINNAGKTLILANIEYVGSDGVNVFNRKLRVDAFAFVVRPPKPTLSPDGGVFSLPQQVSINSNYADTHRELAYLRYYYNVDVGDGSSYSTPLTINETTTVYAWVESCYNNNIVYSDTVSAEYIIRSNPQLATAIEPIITNTDGDDAPSTTVDFDSGQFTDDEGNAKNLSNTKIGNVLYTLPAADGGYVEGNEDTPAGIELGTSLTDEELAAARKLTPGTTSYAKAFKGMTIMVPGGIGEIVVKAQTEANAVLNVQIGDSEPVQIAYADNEETHIAYELPQADYAYIYHGGTLEAQASRVQKAIFRDKRESAHIKVTSLSAQASAMITPATDSDVSQVKVFALSESNFVPGGIVVNEVCGQPVTEVGSNVFDGVDDKGSVAFIDMSASSVTGINVPSEARKQKASSSRPLRQGGLFEGFGNHTLICLPAGNGDGGDCNVVVDGVCSHLWLDAHEPFVTPIDFTASFAELDRAYIPEMVATVMLPFAVPALQAASLGQFYTLKDIRDGFVILNAAEAGSLEANKPYVFVPAVSKIAANEVAVTRLEGDAVEDNRLIGTYKRKSDMPDSDIFVLHPTEKGAFAIGGAFRKADAASVVEPYQVFLKTEESRICLRLAIDGRMPAVGDVDGDDKLDVGDMILLMKCQADGTDNPAADINGDGIIDARDLQLIISNKAQ